MIAWFSLWYPSLECLSFHYILDGAKRRLDIDVVVRAEPLSTYVCSSGFWAACKHMDVPLIAQFRVLGILHCILSTDSIL